MRYLTLLLVVTAIWVGLSLPTDPVTREGVACDYVNAYALSDSLTEGRYITITGSCQGQTCTEHPCGGETLSTCYAVTLDSQCPPFSAGPSYCVQGNNLSGHYLIAVRIGNCLKLCACQ